MARPAILPPLNAHGGRRSLKGSGRAGVRLEPDAPPEQIRVAIQRILHEPWFRDEAERLGTAVASQDGARAAADELESLVL